MRKHTTIVTATAKNAKESVCAYTIGFVDKRYNESGYAQEATQMLAVQLKEKQFTSQQLRDLEEKIVNIYDEPYANT